MRSALLPALTLGMVVSLAACGGGSDHTSVPPLSETPSPSADQGSAAKAAVAAYLAAVTTLPADATPAALGDVATPTWAAGFVGRYRKNIVDHGMTLIGSNKLVSATPQISGDTATVDACVDGTHVFVVPKGATTAESGDQPSPRARYTYTLRLQDGHWLVDGLATKGQPC